MVNSGIDNEISRWIIIGFGIFLLFFGAYMYYSTVRFFGIVIGAIGGLIGGVILFQGSPSSPMIMLAIYILCALVGAAIGMYLTMIFHHMIFFIAGAIITLVLFKMFVQKLITPAEFSNLTPDKLIELVRPVTMLESAVAIIGGLIYVGSSHLLIVITMSLLGSYLIAWGFNIYILFPILAALGGIIQWSTTRGRRRVVVIRKPK